MITEKEYLRIAMYLNIMKLEYSDKYNKALKSGMVNLANEYEKTKDEVNHLLETVEWHIIKMNHLED